MTNELIVVSLFLSCWIFLMLFMNLTMTFAMFVDRLGEHPFRSRLLWIWILLVLFFGALIHFGFEYEAEQYMSGFQHYLPDYPVNTHE